MNPDAGFEEDVALLEREQAAQIYREMFYDKYRVGEIDDFSMASHVFDLVVHHGPGKAAQIVQEAINRMVEELTALTGEELKGTSKKFSFFGRRRFRIGLTIC